MIKFAFQHWNVEYEWWCPNTVPHDFVVDGVKTAPVTHSWQWFNIGTIADSDKDLASKALACPAVKADFLYHGCNVRYTILDDVVGKEKYIFPIMIKDGDYFRLNEQGFDLIESRVFQDVHEGRARIVLMFPFEGTSGHKGPTENDFKILDSWCKKYNLNSNQVYYIHGNLKCQQLAKGMNFTAVPIDVFVTWVPYVPDSISEFKPQNNKNLFLSYNRRPRPHRIILLCELIRARLLDRGLVSYGGDYVKNTHWRLEVSDLDRLDLAPEAEILDSLIPMEIDLNLVENNPACNIEQAHYESTFVSVVPETLYDENTLFFSEKTWKTIAAGHPFFLISSPGMLDKLRSKGFYTYGSFWSEAYDELETISDRIQAVIAELQKLSLLDEDKLTKLRNDMRPIVEYNQQRFRTMWRQSQENQQQKVLLDCVKEIWTSF
jgi:hypothetical protein